MSPQQTSSQAPGRFNGNRFNLAFNGEGVGKRVHGSTKAALPPRSPGPPSTVSPQEGKTADVQLAVADESVPSWFSVARTIVSDGGRKTPLTRHMSIESYTSNQSHGSLSFSDSDSDCEVGGSAERHREELDGGTLLSAEANGTLWQVRFLCVICVVCAGFFKPASLHAFEVEPVVFFVRMVSGCSGLHAYATRCRVVLEA